MSIGRIALAALLAGVLAASACGRKGEPERPGPDQDPKKPAATATTN